MKWVNLKKRLPDEKEQSKNWKFLVCNKDGGWTDTAYYNPKNKENLWNNGECTIYPSHWRNLPKPIK